MGDRWGRSRPPVSFCRLAPSLAAGPPAPQAPTAFGGVCGHPQAGTAPTAFRGPCGRPRSGSWPWHWRSESPRAASPQPHPTAGMEGGQCAGNGACPVTRPRGAPTPRPLQGQSSLNRAQQPLYGRASRQRSAAGGARGAEWWSTLCPSGLPRLGWGWALTSLGRAEGVGRPIPWLSQ